jgi:hypothetical protein
MLSLMRSNCYIIPRLCERPVCCTGKALQKHTKPPEQTKPNPDACQEDELQGQWLTAAGCHEQQATVMGV